MTKLKPINGHLLIKIPEKKDRTKSGIFLATNDDQRMEHGVVISSHGDSEIKKGSTVYFKLYSLTPITIEDIEYNFVKEEEVIAVG